MNTTHRFQPLRALAVLDPDSRRRWYLLLPLALAAAALEGLCTFGVVHALRSLSGSGLDAHVGVLCLGGAALYLARGLVRLLETRLRHRAACTSADALAARLLERYLRAPHLWHVAQHPGRMVHRLSSTVQDVCRTMLYSTFGMVLEGLTILAIVGILVLTSPPAVIAAAATLALMVAGSLALTQERLRALGRADDGLRVAAAKRLDEIFRALKEIRLLGLAEPSARALRGAWEAHSVVDEERGTYAGAPRLFLETAFMAGVLTVAGVAFLAGAGARVLPLLGVYVYAGSRLLPTLSVFVYHVGEAGFRGPALDALDEDFARLDALPPPPPPVRFTRSLALEDVAFAYPGRTAPALDGVSLELARGRWLGIVGASGAGKSTLLDLLLGELEPGRGRILADGGPVARLAFAPGQAGYVPQAAYLVDGTLAEAIVPPVLGEAPDQERIRACLALAGLDDLLAGLPEGTATPIGDRGQALSAGQRQRLALARALYGRPDLLVLDEATAALDLATERAVLERIRAARPELTVVLVSHRLATVESCDQVLMLEAGSVAALGTTDELLIRSGAFRRLMQGDGPRSLTSPFHSVK